MRKVRKLRHWKQQYDKNAKFVWRKSILYGNGYTKIGGPISKELFENKHRLRNFWEAGVIELALFEEPQDILRPANRPPPILTTLEKPKAEDQEAPKGRGRPKKTFTGF